MSFTDDDLKRLKNDIRDQNDWHLTKVPIKALLARLEAAEKAAEDTGSPELYKAWRKAAGK